MSGPTTPASASPEVTPNVPIATAIASSKLFPAAVKARVELCAYGKRSPTPSANDPVHMIAKYAKSGMESTFGTYQPLEASISWQVNWALSDDAGVVGGEGLLADSVTSATRPLRVLQVESVITQ